MAEVVSYYKEDECPNNRVSFSLLDKNGDVLRKHEEAACFSILSQYSIPKDIRSIRIFHKKSLVPYNNKSVERWIADINEAGFPCSLIPAEKSGEDAYVFEVNFKNFTYKAHLIHTLMLIRALYERYICVVPEIYFQMMDKNPSLDKFHAIQLAHRYDFKDHPHSGWQNSNHMITYNGNGKPISYEKLLENYQSCRKVYYGKPGEYQSLGYSGKWCG